MPLWGFLLSFTVAVLWAASPIMVAHGLALSKCSPNDINPIRSIPFFAVSLLITYVHTKGNIPLVLSPMALLYIVGNVLFGYLVGDLLYFTAIREIGISRAVPISNAYPMLVVFTSWFMLGEEITLRIMLGVVIVIAGLLLLRFGGGRTDHGEKRASGEKIGLSKFMKGFLFAVGAGIAWAVGAPMTKLAMVSSGLGPVEITFYRSVAFLVMSWCHRIVLMKYFPGSLSPLRIIPAKGWGYFFGSAVLGLAISSIMYAACIRVMPVAVVTAITATSPFIAALFGHFVLRDELKPVQWAGVIMIISGSVTVSI